MLGGSVIIEGVRGHPDAEGAPGDAQVIQSGICHIAAAVVYPKPRTALLVN
jgi:hypothetical protein